MKKLAILIMISVLMVFGCGDGGGNKDDADAAGDLVDQEAIEDTAPDPDIAVEDLPTDIGPGEDVTPEDVAPEDVAPEDAPEDEAMDVPFDAEEDVHEVIPDTPEEFDPEQACIDSGGTVDTMLCCLTVDDFPNLCLEGPCGCAPDYSHEIQVCMCGSGQCFNGLSCVPF